jgi:hypothetical protein
VIATNPATYATLIEDAGSKAEAALTAARATPDDTKRDAAVLAAKNGAAAAADGAKKLAAYHRDDAQTKLKTEQSAKMTAAAGPRDAAALSNADLAGAQTAFDDGKIAIANAAAAELARLAETEAAVRTVNEAAAEKQASASLPGADANAKLDALIAARDAAEALSDKATAGFSGLVAGLPPAPVGNVPMPPDPEAPFVAAMTALKAATGAATAWVGAAKDVEKAAKTFEEALGKIALPTAVETAVLQAMTNAKAPAAVQTGRAETALQALAADAKTLREKVTGKAGKPGVPGSVGVPPVPPVPPVPGWTQWANTHHRVPVVDAGTKKLQDIAGFALALQVETKVPAHPEADMMRVGPSMKKVPYTGPAIVPGVANGQPADIDMKHITDRHVPGTYKFVPESSPKGSEHDAGTLLEGKLIGIGKTTREKNLIKQGKSNKANSFFPEIVDAPAALTMARDALTAAAALRTPPGLPPWLFLEIASVPASVTVDRWKKVWFDPPVNVNLPGAIPPTTLSVTVGIGIAANPGVGPNAKPKVRMFYPNTGDKLSMPDVLVMAKAVGVSQ